VERINRLLRYCLARFTHKTYCWSKSLNMIINSVFFYPSLAMPVKKPIKLWVCSGYRSIERQTKLFNNQVEREKKRKSKNPEQDASRVVAKPRQSEHNIGLAVDINCVDTQFKNQKEYEWLKQHAQDYGFIERYQEGWEEKTGCIPEPWHWRYVGVENAKEIKKSGKCLEEFVIDKIEKIQQNKKDHRM